MHGMDNTMAALRVFVCVHTVRLVDAYPTMYDCISRGLDSSNACRFRFIFVCFIDIVYTAALNYSAKRGGSALVKMPFNPPLKSCRCLGDFLLRVDGSMYQGACEALLMNAEPRKLLFVV